MSRKVVNPEKVNALLYFRYPWLPACHGQKGDLTVVIKTFIREVLAITGLALHETGNSPGVFFRDQGVKRRMEAAPGSIRVG